MRALPLLLTLLLSACSSAPTTRYLQVGQPATAMLVQTSTGGSKLFTLVNAYVDPVEAGLPRGSVSVLDDDLMIGVVAQLEAFRFFNVAVPGVPANAGRDDNYVAVFLPGGSWYLTKARDPLVFNKALKTVVGTYNFGDRTVMSGNNQGQAPVDFQRQQEELRRLNRERLEKYR
ncbi:MAG: hypothetical protein R3F30_13880 [Planctomycetota bacterium]